MELVEFGALVLPGALLDCEANGAGRFAEAKKWQDALEVGHFADCSVAC